MALRDETTAIGKFAELLLERLGETKCSIELQDDISLFWELSGELHDTFMILLWTWQRANEIR